MYPTIDTSCLSIQNRLPNSLDFFFLSDSDQRSGKPGFLCPGSNSKILEILQRLANLAIVTVALLHLFHHPHLLCSFGVLEGPSQHHLPINSKFPLFSVVNRCCRPSSTIVTLRLNSCQAKLGPWVSKF